MALTVKESRVVKSNRTGTDDAITLTVTVKYAIENDAADPSTMDPITVEETSGIPKVNRTPYSTEDGVLPYVICRTVSVDQDPKRLARWHATCTFTGTAKAGGLPTAVATIADLLPSVQEELGEYQKVLYVDKLDERVMTPTGNWYSEPLMERIALRVRTVEQYESFVSYKTMRDRRFKTNEGGYEAESVRSWLIENVTGVEVEIPITVTGGTFLAAKMTYTLVHNPELWVDERALIDTHHLDGGVKTEFRDGDLKTQKLGFINILGEKLADQTANPDYQTFYPYDKTDFDAFLQL